MTAPRSHRQTGPTGKSLTNVPIRARRVMVAKLVQPEVSGLRRTVTAPG